MTFWQVDDSEESGTRKDQDESEVLDQNDLRDGCGRRRFRTRDCGRSPPWIYERTDQSLTSGSCWTWPASSDVNYLARVGHWIVQQIVLHVDVSGVAVGVEVGPLIAQYHADFPLGEEAARAQVWPRSRRIADFAHLAGALRRPGVTLAAPAEVDRSLRCTRGGPVSSLVWLVSDVSWHSDERGCIVRCGCLVVTHILTYAPCAERH